MSFFNESTPFYNVTYCICLFSIASLFTNSLSFIFKFCAFLGCSCVPLAYLIVWELTHNLWACILAASLILFGELIFSSPNLLNENP